MSNRDKEHQKYKDYINKNAHCIDSIISTGTAEHIKNLLWITWLTRANTPPEPEEKKPKAYFYRIKFNNKDRGEVSGITRGGSADEAFEKVVRMTREARDQVEYLGEAMSQKRYEGMTKEEKIGFLSILGVRPGDAGFESIYRHINFEEKVGNIVNFSLVEG